MVSYLHDKINGAGDKKRVKGRLPLTGDGRGRGGPSPPEASAPQRKSPTRLSLNLRFSRNSSRSRKETEYSLSHCLAEMTLPRRKTLGLLPADISQKGRFSMSIATMIPRRRSVRAYKAEAINAATLADLRAYMNQLVPLIPGAKVEGRIIPTDHGSIRVNTPTKVVGDRNVNTNLRYKLGKNLSYNPKEVYEVKQPKKLLLPQPNLSTAYIFATGARFFAYPNNYNYYVQYYKDTFQHGGISMEEMLIPLISLKAKGKR